MTLSFCYACLVFNLSSIHCIVITVKYTILRLYKWTHFIVYSYFTGTKNVAEVDPSVHAKVQFVSLRMLVNTVETWHASVHLIQWFQILKIDCGKLSTRRWPGSGLFNAYNIATKHIIKQILNSEPCPCGFSTKRFYFLLCFLFFLTVENY